MSRPPRRSWGGWLVFILVLLLAAGAWVGWTTLAREREATALDGQRVERLVGDVQALRKQVQDMANHDAEVTAALQQQHDELGGLSGRMDDSLRAGRGRIQLVAIEELLLLANDRLLLARDPGTAERALEEAD